VETCFNALSEYGITLGKALSGTARKGYSRIEDRFPFVYIGQIPPVWRQL